MQITVSIEPLSNQGFLARSGEPLPESVTAPTRDEALNQLRQLLERRLNAGLEIVTLEVAKTRHPLSDLVGDLKGNPLLEEWKVAMAQYRRQRDAEEDAP